MKIQDVIEENNLGKKIIERLSKVPDGEGLTKQDLATEFGCGSATTVEKWMRAYPEITKHRVYLRVGRDSNRTRQAIFVNLKYKKSLIENNYATENY